MANSVLADSIQEIPHIDAFEQLWATRLNAIEIDQVLVYIIDTVTAEALPYLAEQFDVAGYKGYKLATTEADKRRIIKQAIELKRYMGTVWAVKQAMVAVGYGDAELIEGVDEGTPDIDWAKFRVVADLGEGKGLNSETASELAGLINEYKNVRSWLLDVSFKLDGLQDQLPPLNDDALRFDYYQPDIVEDLGWKSRFHDGTYLRNGAINYNDGNDILKIQIL